MLHSLVLLNLDIYFLGNHHLENVPRALIILLISCKTAEKSLSLQAFKEVYSFGEYHLKKPNQGGEKKKGMSCQE